ncbi:DUF2490 domain-containing protein [Hymenobacter aquaticus]|uniref:DUF2490 domain-containing protein n=1 Tax=Hymenobacter aquaticus TaxID=1867101 RepID=A0A4Z0Q5B6_9BACT|nr:DUF2490 domain-containing protein [Hymenobacter aquaticus]TGE25278.1 DUF2490 domain-containing protein [Hymenobacter aquaticus]
MHFLGPGAAALFFLGSFAAFGQTQRIPDRNNIGWYVYEGDHPLSKRWTLHTEYQWRRTHFLTRPQQQLARLGAAYQLRPRVQVAAGYTNLITRPYGDFPTADTGVPFPEHRLYQDVQLSDTLGRVVLEQRGRLEQRWQGQLEEGQGRRVQRWEYQNRIRYQLSAVLPLQGPRLDAREWYLTGFDEVFLSFGRNVGKVFNQNRLAGGVGYQVQDNFRLELLYLNQITQHADDEPVSGLPVFEFNQGFRLGVNYNLTLGK